MQNPYKQLSSRETYRCDIFSVREDWIEKPGGKQDSFSVIEVIPGSAALPLTPEGDVYLIREYKYAIGRESMEAASGGSKPGESPLETAKREMHEELGLLAEEWIPLGYTDPFTTQLNGPIHLFLARGLTTVDPMPDEGEIIEVVRMPFAEAVNKVLRNEITHAGSCVLILRAYAFLTAAV